MIPLYQLTTYYQVLKHEVQSKTLRAYIIVNKGWQTTMNHDNHIARKKITVERYKGFI